MKRDGGGMANEARRLDYATPVRRGIPVWAWVLIGLGGMVVLMGFVGALVRPLFYRTLSVLYKKCQGMVGEFREWCW